MLRWVWGRYHPFIQMAHFECPVRYFNHSHPFNFYIHLFILLFIYKKNLNPSIISPFMSIPFLMILSSSFSSHPNPNPNRKLNFIFFLIHLHPNPNPNPELNFPSIFFLFFILDTKAKYKEKKINK